MTTEQKLQHYQDQDAIRELVNNYGYYADQKAPKKQAALFTSDTQFEIFYDPSSKTPTQVVTGSANLPALFEASLNPFKATMHFIGQSTSHINGNYATGTVYCMAHHLSFEDGKQKMMVAAIRYLDTYVKETNVWLFAKRQLMVDWIENR